MLIHFGSSKPSFQQLTFDGCDGKVTCHRILHDQLDRFKVVVDHLQRGVPGIIIKAFQLGDGRIEQQ